MENIPSHLEHNSSPMTLWLKLQPIYLSNCISLKRTSSEQVVKSLFRRGNLEIYFVFKTKQQPTTVSIISVSVYSCPPAAAVYSTYPVHRFSNVCAQQRRPAYKYEPPALFVLIPCRLSWSTVQYQFSDLSQSVPAAQLKSQVSRKPVFPRADILWSPERQWEGRKESKFLC